MRSEIVPQFTSDQVQTGQWVALLPSTHRLTSEKANRWQFSYRTCSYSSLHPVLTLEEPQSIAHTGVTASSERAVPACARPCADAKHSQVSLCIVFWEKRTDQGPKEGLLLVSLIPVRAFKLLSRQVYCVSKVRKWWGRYSSNVPHLPHDLYQKSWRSSWGGVCTRTYTHQKGLRIKLLFSFLLIP